jgi:hypothetical protein
MRTPIPWIALAAVAAMFLLPWLDARGLFDGPRTIHHHPRRHVCTDCGNPWTPGHQCPGWLEAARREPVVPMRPIDPPEQWVHAQLTRPDAPGRLALPRWALAPLLAPASGSPVGSPSVPTGGDTA